ncbi:hypothetical protein RS694_17945 [Rhodoferax saidenbachensis]|uniref:histidine kinase n=1 Tax=Rhodoferax saidenbachensis TaxID=1484693 RepID=A0A1P8KE35_9BURK|nr:hypothetical protein RS694_17945 [Rhodoferax saidenbachensis]
MRLRIIAIGALVISALVGSAVYDSWQLHEQLKAWNYRALGNLARALSSEANRNFQSVDLLLMDTAVWYQDAALKATPTEIEQALSARVTGLGQVSVLTIVDAQGMQRYRSRDTGRPLTNVADRPYFTTQRDAQFSGLYINEPIVTRSEALPALVMSRRLNDAKGGFAGVVTAIVTLDEFRDMYSTFQMNEGSSLLLTLDDGTLVARNPVIPGLKNDAKFPELALFKSGDAVDRVISPLDGRAKFVAALPVGNHPLIIAITRDEADALAPWVTEMRSAAIRTTLLSLLIIFTIHGLLRQLRKVSLGEQALRESEERYAMTMDAANSGHAEWNIKSDSIFLSEKWRTLHGLATGEPISTIRELIAAVPMHEEDRLPTKEALDEHLAGKSRCIEVEYRVLHADNKWRWIHARAKSLMDAQNRPLRIYCAVADVTERHEALAAKLELERRLQQTQRLESLGTLAGGIAHDFNNILGAILGFGEMAHQKAPPGTDMHRHLSRVMQAGDRARLLVRRILDFSRSGVADHTPVHIQSVVEEAVSMLSPVIPVGVRLRSELAAGNAAVMGDATQLYQVATNLCTNALQAVGDAGAITVRLYHQDVAADKALVLGSLSVGAYVCLEITDTGPGMAPHVLQSMFNPFFTTKKGNEGTGLGLSVVHGVVADHGGAIDVASALGKGTTMYIWLPIEGSGVPHFPPSPLRLTQGQGQTVMVVDDEAALVELTEELLASLGYEPVGFSNAEAALAAFQASPNGFDAVLSDEMLPGMSGSELAARLRALRATVPIILMSGKITPDLEAGVRDGGIDLLLHKPLQLGEIADALQRVVAVNARDGDVTFAKEN